MFVFVFFFFPKRSLTGFSPFSDARREFGVASFDSLDTVLCQR
jgi:hypothetical protein